MAIIQWALSKMPTTMIETPRTKPKKIQAIDADFLLRNSVDLLMKNDGGVYYYSASHSHRHQQVLSVGRLIKSKF
jgi:hypothetical protein